MLRPEPCWNKKLPISMHHYLFPYRAAAGSSGVDLHERLAGLGGSTACSPDQIADGAEVRGEEAFVGAGGVAVGHAGEEIADEAGAGGFVGRGA